MGNTYFSNRLENLCQTLAEDIRKNNDSVFGKEVIITQTAGMNSWLSTDLARRNSVFANFEFLNQDGLLAGIYQLLFGERPKNNIDAIKYKIYNYLGSKAFQDKFGEVFNYYSGDDLRRIQLSAKIADLFDQYQLYRPDMILNWENDKLSTGNSSEIWQQWLWTKLNLESRTKIRQKIEDQLEAQKDLIRKTYPRISFFGITVYTRFHIDFFRILANYTNVTFYHCVPTDQTAFKNDLLVSFGSKALELMKMTDMQQFKPVQVVEDSMLARIQNQIINNTTDIDVKDDESLQINSCFTPVREVESLFNYLTDLFIKDKNLLPRDVLVMASDINKYAPFIRAVFKNAPVNIPFQISGAANNSDDSIASAIEQIMNFTEENLTSEKVISLLEQKRIKQRYGIQDCSYIRVVLKKANIRFGRVNNNDDESHFVSWKYGLDKILLGYAMLTTEEYPAADGLTLYPFRDTESSESYDLLRIKAFVGQLESVIDEQSNNRTLAEWKKFLFAEVIDKMVFHDDFDKDDRAELSSVYKALDFINTLDSEEKVPFEIFLEELKLKLFTESRESKLNTGRVTVSSPIPVRGIPFKVICFLGLNNDIFPRKDRYMGFDLLGEDYRMGDRNKKETDKYLFLDTLLAASEKLYLSYIGQSIKDNTEFPPSIVIDTLLNYLGTDAFLAKHPLQGFSSNYQKDDKRLFTYLYADAASSFKHGETKSNAVPELSVYTFVSFFENPVEWYYKNILKINFEETDDTLPETELFGLDNLEKWLIKNELLRVKDNEIDLYYANAIKEGKLPLKNSGRVTLDEIVQEIAIIKSGYQLLTQNLEEKNVEIDLSIDNLRITGAIDSVYGDEYIAYTFSENSKHWVAACLKTLLLCAADKIKSALFLDRDGGKTSIPVLKAEDARSKLKILLEYLTKGSQAPLKFTLKASEAALKKTGDIEKVMKAIRSEAYGNRFSGMEPNPYIRILCEEGYFEDFDEKNFNEIKALSALLNLYTV